MLENQIDIKCPVNLTKFKNDVNYKAIIFAKYKLELYKYCKTILHAKNIKYPIDLNGLIYSELNKTINVYSKLKHKISFRRLLFNNCKFKLLTELVRNKKKNEQYYKIHENIKSQKEDYFIDYNTPEIFFNNVNETEDFYSFLKKYKKKRTVKIINMLINGKSTKYIIKKLSIPKHTYYNDIRTFIKKAREHLVLHSPSKK